MWINKNAGLNTIYIDNDDSNDGDIDGDDEDGDSGDDSCTQSPRLALAIQAIMIDDKIELLFERMPEQWYTLLF